MKCPFSIGDLVVYAPDSRMLGLNVMTDLANLVQDRTYTIVDIVNDMYVVIDGFQNSPTGGLSWEAFKPHVKQVLGAEKARRNAA